ncbi:MAG: gamma carbonic anhydrase family protein [Candidatus Altiarchaeota archaeon]
MIDKSVYVAEGARIVGSVTIGEDSSVWHNAVIRGDRSRIIIGKCSNVQDLCVIHSPERFPVRIGDHVTIGHGAKVHGAEVADNTLIGMGAILMNGCKIGGGSVVAAASVVTENTIIPPGSLVIGTPAKVVRKLSPEEIDSIRQNALEYKALAAKSRSHKASR